MISPVKNILPIVVAIVGTIILSAAATKLYGFAYDRGHKAGRENLAQEMAAAAKTKETAEKDRSAGVVKKVQTVNTQRKAYIAKAEKEIEHESTPLAECRVPDSAVRLWNEATRCIMEPTSAGCRAD